MFSKQENSCPNHNSSKQKVVYDHPAKPVYPSMAHRFVLVPSNQNHKPVSENKEALINYEWQTDPKEFYATFHRSAQSWQLKCKKQDP